MPFTFCHPAIVLPFTRVSKNYLSASALIAGSMAPDFEYFLKMKMEGIHGHTVLGIFYFNLPVTIGMLFLFHLFVRDALIQNLPSIFQRRFKTLLGFNWLAYAQKKWYVIIYSALLGICSHLFWDSFTHQGRYFANHIPFLKGTINVFNLTLLRTEFAQLLSSVIGAFIIFGVLLFPYKQPLNFQKIYPKLRYWITVIGLTCVISGIRNPTNFSELIATSISAGMLSLIIAPLLLNQLNVVQKK